MSLLFDFQYNSIYSLTYNHLRLGLSIFRATLNKLTYKLCICIKSMRSLSYKSIEGRIFWANRRGSKMLIYLDCCHQVLSICLIRWVLWRSAPQNWIINKIYKSGRSSINFIYLDLSRQALYVRPRLRFLYVSARCDPLNLLLIKCFVFLYQNFFKHIIYKIELICWFIWSKIHLVLTIL